MAVPGLGGGGSSVAKVKMSIKISQIRKIKCHYLLRELFWLASNLWLVILI